MSHSNYHNGQLCHPEDTTLYLSSKGTHDDADLEFVQPLHLRGKQFALALSKIKLWLTMQNIKTELNNNVFEYYVGGVLKTVNLPDGNYGLPELNTRLQRSFATEGVLSNAVTFDGNSSDNVVTMALAPTVRVDFSSPAMAGMALLLGMDTVNNDNVGANPVYVDGVSEPRFNYYYSPESGTSVEIVSIHIQCDAVGGRVYSNTEKNPRIGRSTHSTIYKLSPSSSPNSLQIEEPYTLDFMHVKSINELTTMRLYLTNQNSEPLGGMITKPILYTLKLKEY